MRGISSLSVLLLVSSISYGAVVTETWDWVTQCQAYHAGFSGNTGVVLHFGDSITYANQYTAWIRGKTGATAEDTAIMSWMHAVINTLGNGPTDNTSDFATIMAFPWQQDGAWLAYVDRAGNGSYTAQSSIRSDQYRNGTYNLPVPEAMLDAYEPEIVIIMLGTNDVTASRTPDAFEADMRNILQHIIWEDGNTSGSYRGTIPIISTIPPYRDKLADSQAMNAKVISLADEFDIPLIDLYGEIMVRQPVNWATTLLAADGVHLSPSGGVYNSGSNPYTPGGDPATHTSGDACENVGYLLRGWLSVQKVKEVKAQAIDGTPGPLTITTSSLPDGNVGVAYSQNLVAIGGTPAYSWSLFSGSLPPGLNLASNGTISGDPTTAGTYNFTVQVTDQVPDTDTQPLSITISSGGPPQVVTIQANKDTYIDAGNPATNYGTDPNMSMGGNNATPGWERISLVEFDLATVPAGSTINEARLKLYANSDARGGEVVISRILQAWTEGGANWTSSGSGNWNGSNFRDGNNWTDITQGSAGSRTPTTYTDGSFTFSCVINGSPQVGSDIDPGYNPAIDDWDGGFIEFDVTEAVSDWIESANPNYGFALCMNGKITRDGGSTWTMYGWGNVAWLTSDFSTPGYEPELIVTYQSGAADETPPTVNVTAVDLNGNATDDSMITPVVTVNGTPVTVDGVGDWQATDLGISSTIVVIAEDANSNTTQVDVDVSVTP